MRISIFGLGYVGAVTAACLARDGHQVLGVDVNSEKVAMIQAGRSPIVEPGLSELLRSGADEGRISATTDQKEAIASTGVSLISVGTPPLAQGAPNLDYVFSVCRDIGEAVREKCQPHVVVLRSTVPPGTMRRCEEILKEAAGDVPVHVAFNPEFLREGSAVQDYTEPGYTVIGTEDPVAEETVRTMYEAVRAPVFVVKPEAAEMVKYVANAWHAAKITFANEVGRMAKAFGVDGRDVMNLIVQEPKLNISPAYLRPGFAYGGSCLPKDVASILYHARAKNIALPFIGAMPTSNAVQIDVAVQEAIRIGARQIAVLGLAFKPNTDDLRESPAVPLVKRLLGEGCQVRIYDRCVHQAHLMGTNLAYIRQNLPHFEQLLIQDPHSALADAELAIVTYATSEIREALLQAGNRVKVLDLAGVFAVPPEGMDYHAICW